MPVWRKEHELSRVVVNYIGMIGTAISALALIGQFTGRSSLYTWGKFGAMSLPTASVLAAFGVAIYLVSRGEAVHDGGKR